MQGGYYANVTKGVTIMQKSIEALKNAFIELERQERKIDDVAGGILSAIKSARANTVDKFDQMVYAAYDANGWNYKPGRPMPGADITKVPAIIKVYVSTVRAAYMCGLSVTTYDSIYQLRQDLRSRRNGAGGNASSTSSGVAGDQATGAVIAGVRLAKPDALIGEAVHDLAVVYIHLEDDKREALAKAIERLVKKFATEVEADIKLAA